jgi:hypothetical protein
LPFHAMRSYPYTALESPPNTRARLVYLERYNTRVVRAIIPSIDGELLSRKYSNVRKVQ